MITGNQSPSYVFEESSAKIAPLILDTNDFVISGGAVMLNPPYFLSGGSTPLTTMAAVNMITGAMGNVTLAPSFISNDMPHISNTSAVKGQGTANGPGPTDDYDGQARPMPAGSNPDIGADEVGG